MQYCTSNCLLPVALAGNIGDMLATCRQHVKMLMNLGIFACGCRLQNSPDTRFLGQKLPTLYPTSKVFLPNFKVVVVAVAMVAARRQWQRQLRRWQWWRRWTRIGGKSGRQQERRLSHDGMRWQKLTADNNATTNQWRDQQKWAVEVAAIATAMAAATMATRRQVGNATGTVMDGDGRCNGNATATTCWNKGANIVQIVDVHSLVNTPLS
jgi:hypothetical protein